MDFFFSFYWNEAAQFFFNVNNETEETKTLFDKSHFAVYFWQIFFLHWNGLWIFFFEIQMAEFKFNRFSYALENRQRK